MNVTLITGASSGLGRAFAKLYAKDGCNLVIVATSLNGLEETKKEVLEINKDLVVDIYQADLSVMDNLDKLLEYTNKKGYFVERLINNAGFGEQVDFKDMDIRKQVKMVEVNCNALMYLTRIYLDDMLKENKGEIINVSSIAAFYPGPHMCTYHATKAFVSNITQAIRYELKDTNIKMLELCPGPFESKFVEKANNYYTFKKKKPVTAEYVANLAYNGIKKDKGVVVVGFTNRVEAFASKFVSRKMVVESTSKQLTGHK